MAKVSIFLVANVLLATTAHFNQAIQIGTDSQIKKEWQKFERERVSLSAEVIEGEATVNENTFAIGREK